MLATSTGYPLWIYHSADSWGQNPTPPIQQLAAGLALHKAWHSRPDNSEDWKALRNDLVETRARMSMLVAEISGLEDEARIFAAGLWRDFYWALLTNAARNAITKLLVVVFALLLLPQAWADSVGHLNLVIAIDLTKSVDVAGPDGKTEFQKNIDGVTGILAKVPAGAHVTIIGITDRSFAQPYILMSSSVSDDPGYFGERLNKARNRLIAEWKSRSLALKPHFVATDIFGALKLASRLLSLDETVRQNVLVVFSDMRNSTSALNLERSFASRPIPLPRGVRPSLQRVMVYLLGVDGAGISDAYWENMTTFWDLYFTQAGAVVRRLSSMREMALP